MYPIGAQAPEKTTERLSNGEHKVYIIDALLDLVLTNSTLSMFDVRMAACECVEAYFYNHKPIKMHFLNRAIEGHMSGDDETSNIITILVVGPRGSHSSEPYRVWFAGILLFHLVCDDPEAKKLVMRITDGDEAKGEEVVTGIQAMTGNLIAALQGADDERICVGYLITLCGLLYEDFEAVNDLLGEGSTVQALIQVVRRNEKDKDIVQGLSTLLLGLIYEFSTKDSAVPRKALHPLLTSNLGREQYVQKLTRLRQHPAVRNFEVTPQNLSSTPPGNLPAVFFDQTSVDFIKDNFSRMLRAIDRDPRMEVVRTHEGVDRDIVDSLRAQLRDKSDAVQKAESDLSDRERRLNQEQADHRKSQETFKAELARIKNINQALQRGHEAESTRIEAEHQQVLARTVDEHQRKTKEITTMLERVQKDAQTQAIADAEAHRVELTTFHRQIEQLGEAVRKANDTIEILRKNAIGDSETIKQHTSQAESLRNEKELLEENISQHITNIRKLETHLQESDKKTQAAIDSERATLDKLKSTEEARQAAQTELDDLLIVLGDLEEKRVKDKVKLVFRRALPRLTISVQKRLKEAGLDTSDADDDDDEDDDDDDDKDDEEEEDDEEEKEEQGKKSEGDKGGGEE